MSSFVTNLILAGAYKRAARSRSDLLKVYNNLNPTVPWSSYTPRVTGSRYPRLHTFVCLSLWGDAKVILGCRIPNAQHVQTVVTYPSMQQRHHSISLVRLVRDLRRSPCKRQHLETRYKIQLARPARRSCRNDCLWLSAGPRIRGVTLKLIVRRGPRK